MTFLHCLTDSLIVNTHPDSRVRMVYLRNLLAKHEIHVANYYISINAWLAAVNRAQYVVENYQLTPAVEMALGIMVEAYTKLGLLDNANNAKQVLEANFGETSTNKENVIELEEEVSQTWFNRLTFDLFE